MSSRWDWLAFCQDTVDGSVRYPSCLAPGADTTYLEWLVSAWGTTLMLAGLAWIVALVAGTLVGIARTLPQRGFVWFGNAWSELFRNIPLLAQLFLWYHVLPQVFPVMKQVPSFALVVIGLGFFTSARVAEQVRAGILTVPAGQRHAGLAMGLTLVQTYRYVLLPRALRIVIPPLTSEAMSIIKNSSVAFAVGVTELIVFAMQAQEDTRRPVEMYLAATALYFLSSIAVNRLALWIEHRVAVPGTPGAGR